MCDGIFLSHVWVLFFSLVNLPDQSCWGALGILPGVVSSLCDAAMIWLGKVGSDVMGKQISWSWGHNWECDSSNCVCDGCGGGNWNLSWRIQELFSRQIQGGCGYTRLVAVAGGVMMYAKNRFVWWFEHLFTQKCTRYVAFWDPASVFWCKNSSAFSCHFLPGNFPKHLLHHLEILWSKNSNSEGSLDIVCSHSAFCKDWRAFPISCWKIYFAAVIRTTKCTPVCVISSSTRPVLLSVVPAGTKHSSIKPSAKLVVLLLYSPWLTFEDLDVRLYLNQAETNGRPCQLYLSTHV